MLDEAEADLVGVDLEASEEVFELEAGLDVEEEVDLELSRETSAFHSQ